MSADPAPHPSTHVGTASTDPVLDPEDQKLVTLARSARARTGAAEGAAVRDTDGRTYTASTVALVSLQLTALQAAVAAAVSSGATGLEAAAVVAAPDGRRAGTDAPGARADEGERAVAELSPSAPIWRADPDGRPAT